MISSTRGRIEDSGVWQDTVDKIHRSVAGENELVTRLRTIVDSFLGRPYNSDALVGGPDRRERLVIDFKSFDCITLIESALSLARSRSRTGFLTELKNTRYRDGRVDWSFRHHYFNDWLRHNHKRGAVKIRTRGTGSRPIEARLGWFDSLPERRIRFHTVPKKDIRLALPRIENGSIIAFASVRSRLDYFHTGLLFSRSPRLSSVDELTLYQARKSAGKVIKEPLTDFLKRERMRGVAFATPLGWGGSR